VNHNFYKIVNSFIFLVFSFFLFLLSFISLSFFFPLPSLHGAARHGEWATAVGIAGRMSNG
jgi:hypothetical protein